ncbi:Hypothetical predicted protein [Octopus vulgaris]|uniref:Uncharacterized protein n=1 Tax=Octopus vulgaris TaxID=6645 RepID=A0AA36AVT7_OCTVU|nr:Hypothetical predicted protein [Octopus vulgaris]
MCCRDGRKTCPWNGLLWFCRLWGLITAAGFWGVGIETAVFHRTIAIYFIITALILLFLEIVFLIDIWLSLCISDDSTCMKLWQYVLWIDTWKKGIFYILLCWPSFLHLQNPYLGILAEHLKLGLYESLRKLKRLTHMTGFQKSMMYWKTISLTLLGPTPSC